MNDSHINSIDDIKEFLQSGDKISFTIPSQKERYDWIGNILLKFKYRKLGKKDRSVVKKYLEKFTAYSNAQIKRLIKKHYQGRLRYDLLSRKRNKFNLKYYPEDIALLIKTDVAHNGINGKAIKKILKREFELFNKKEYENVSEISISHIYNIRNHNRQYNSSEAKFFKKTKAVNINIGIRRKPRPNGRPGCVRVDTVHQGDMEGKKGVYHINIVDEVTQWEMVATVEQISEYYLKPIIEVLLELFPFKIYEFHSDNGSEFINRVVVELLNKLHIELTKSRSRHTNDNALVESKNGSVVRRLYGKNFIPKKYAKMINEFNLKYVNIYLNYHRPCGFAVNKIDGKGKIKKVYDIYLTPYEALKSLPNASKFLKDGISFEILDKIAYAKSDNEFALEMLKAKRELFKKIKS